MMYPDILTAEHVAQELTGTCNEITDVIPQEDLDDNKKYPIEFFEELNSKVLQCGQCGWWFGVGKGINIYDNIIICDDCKGSL